MHAGDHVEITVKLITPIALEEGLRFAIREGGRTVGSAPLPLSSSNGVKRHSKSRGPPLKQAGLRAEECPLFSGDRRDTVVSLFVG